MQLVFANASEIETLKRVQLRGNVDISIHALAPLCVWETLHQLVQGHYSGPCRCHYSLADCTEPAVFEALFLVLVRGLEPRTY
jgi:hypothetical protein